MPLKLEDVVEICQALVDADEGLCKHCVTKDQHTDPHWRFTGHSNKCPVVKALRILGYEN